MEPSDGIIGFIKPTEYSNWVCYPFGYQTVTVRVQEGKEPCWFHRWMHRILLGFVWEKEKK